MLDDARVSVRRGSVLLLPILTVLGATAVVVPSPPAESVSARASVNGRTVVLGDSLSYWGGGELRARVPGVEVRGKRGRPVTELPGMIEDYLATEGAPSRLVIALGTNNRAGWSKQDYVDAVSLVPARTEVVFMSVHRTPEVFGEERTRTMKRYSRWMRRIAEARPRTQVVPWRRKVIRNPDLLRDGVHATYERGEDVWARMLARALR
ncbi:SGNH/GDSL hydrolase family protein [Nocardioides donggukensis]|uniref:SGNH/GDSL hydrolase family protein n=1 Tax=Nocardioides donggukensis TaxID=2774019 RepID=A0A927K5F3_9ACTN|nr:SGNH/GDSL hydrolase family protein [Nocardioides donggukensis]MBD8871077.1 SGNH/GDSL hydrolase family protein [Nocardioides donggukensis]